MKFIIENRTKYSDATAIRCVATVMDGGMISGEGTATGLQYCYATRFNDGTVVSVVKRKSGTQKFVVHHNDGIDHSNATGETEEARG